MVEGERSGHVQRHEDAHQEALVLGPQGDIEAVDDAAQNFQQLTDAYGEKKDEDTKTGEE